MKAVAAALGDIAAKDQLLLTRQAYELALVHRFGVYLETHLQPVLRQYGLTVDLDYDRHWDRRKLLPRLDRHDERRFRPDLIVHHRGDDSCNLLVVEWKKNADGLTMACLEKRIRSLIVNEDKHPAYGYEIGVLADSSDDGVRWRVIDSASAVYDWQQVGSS